MCPVMTNHSLYKKTTLYSSVQFKTVSMHLEKPIYVFHSVSQKFPQCCLLNGSNVCLIDDGPLSSFQGRSSSTSSFNASLLQVIDGVMSLALCPQVVSEASQHFRSSEKQATRVASPGSPLYMYISLTIR